MFVTIREAEKIAKKKIRKGTYNWLISGAEDGWTNEKNFIDLKKIKLIPHILKKNYNLSLKQKFLNLELNFPLVVSPMGHQTQFEKNGEYSTAQGAYQEDILSFFSTQGRISFDQIKKKIPKGNIIWQIFPFGNKSWIESEIKRAENFKSPAICFCFDAPVRSHRYVDRESRYDARKFGKRTYETSPDPSFALKYDWDFIKWVKSKTNLPIIPKGLLNITDINRCYKIGVGALWISNHGGRMFNSGITPVEILMQMQKFRGKIKIIVDGGVRQGTDIIKYLCLGADIVGIGRPAIYGLICNGPTGVSNILSILKSELITAMYNGGFKSLKDMKLERLTF